MSVQSFEQLQAPSPPRFSFTSRVRLA